MVAVVGPPGIGKTRLTAEAVAHAKSIGVEVFSTFCESHATDVPFHAVARLLRAAGQISGLDDHSARARARARYPDADPQDLLLLDDLLGITDPEVELPKVDPDARRRRLTALINPANWPAANRRSSSWRMRTGWTRSANRCSPTFSRWFPRPPRWC